MVDLSNACPGPGWCRHRGGGGQEESPRERSTGAGSGRAGGMGAGPGVLELSSDGHWGCVRECAEGRVMEERDWRPRGD